MVVFRILNSDGSPASCLQVIIKNPGQWDYGFSDDDGHVAIPHRYNSGSVVVGGQIVHCGDLAGTIYLP